jgi:uncharacterized protein DUF6196
LLHISDESEEQTHRRLTRVLECARVTSYAHAFCFEETPLETPPRIDERCLALVRNDTVWSALVPGPEGAGTSASFGLLRFEFDSDADNSGFVGWLATHLKRALGTGIFVICGHDSSSGGIYDYWGFPIALRKDVLREVAALGTSS